MPTEQQFVTKTVQLSAIYNLDGAAYVFDVYVCVCAFVERCTVLALVVPFLMFK